MRQAKNFSPPSEDLMFFFKHKLESLDFNTDDRIKKKNAIVTHHLEVWEIIMSIFHYVLILSYIVTNIMSKKKSNMTLYVFISVQSAGERIRFASYHLQLVWSRTMSTVHG